MLFGKNRDCLRLAVRLADVQWSIRGGDVLLYRHAGGRKLSSLLIARLGRTAYIHAAMAARDRTGTLHCLHTLQWRGGRDDLLADAVAASPGQWDVYAMAPWSADALDVDRPGAVAAMRTIIRNRYGWWMLFYAAIRHLPLVRLWMRPEMDDEANGTWPPYCSMAVARAWRMGGRVDLVPNLSDRLTEPGDLARSALLRYRFTLMP